MRNLRCRRRADDVYTGTKDSLYQVRLLSALRSGMYTRMDLHSMLTVSWTGDPAQIHPFLADIGRDRRGSSDSEVDFGATALHLAIRCASCEYS